VRDVCSVKHYALILFSATREIEYSISTFTKQQLKKKKSSRGRPIRDVVTLDSKAPWSTLKIQILAKINAALDPPSLNFFEYNITFTVPRQEGAVNQIKSGG
jgi:hypothetical protein